MILDTIWLLTRRFKRAEDQYRNKIRAAKNYSDRQSLESQMQFDLEMIEDEIRVIVTRKLVQEARSLDIPVPSAGESWAHSRTELDGYLNDEVRDSLKQRIRREKKERRELQFGLWKDILLLSSGLLALVQLIWTLHRK